MPADDAPVRSLRKAKGQGAERREEILAHAERIFAQHGVQSVSTRQIADAVGVSQPTLYAYFPRKSDLLDEVSVRAFAQVEAMSARIHAGPGRSLRDIAYAYVAFGLEHPDPYRIAFMIEHPEADGPPPDEEDMKPGLNAFGNLRDAVARHLGERHPDIEVCSQSLWAGMHGLVALLLVRCSFPWVDRDRLIDWHVEALLRGLPPAKASESAPSA
ncbi:TetR/AcrR family transcriptional regulator [soil metagenome]